MRETRMKARRTEEDGASQLWRVGEVGVEEIHSQFRDFIVPSDGAVVVIAATNLFGSHLRSSCVRPLWCGSVVADPNGHNRQCGITLCESEIASCCDHNEPQGSILNITRSISRISESLCEFSGEAIE